MAQKKVRLLCDSYLGKADDVVLMDPDDIKVAKAAGLIDDHKDAVAYAEAQKRPAAEGDAPLE